MIGHLILWLRWQGRGRRSVATAPEGTPGAVGLDRCRIVYINLERRPDRREAIEAELHRIGVGHAVRLVAFDRPNGAQGCAESHLEALTAWETERTELLLVCEDDAIFLVDRPSLDKMIETFVADPSMDVLCLGFNAKNEIPVSEAMSITSNTQTTSCYVLKRHMKVPCLAVARRSAESFHRRRRGVPIDQAWKALQRRWFFVIPRVRPVQQRASFSDVERRFVEYRV